MTNGRRFLLASAVLLGACGAPLPGDEQSAGEGNGDVNAQSRVCPGSTKTYGIDVSYYEGTIDWNAVKASGKLFALIRVSDGTGFHDPKFASNWHGAKAAGVAVGAYQFFRPGQDPVAQANLLTSALSSVGFGAGDIPPVTDVEVTDGVSAGTIAARVTTWLKTVQSKTGRRPIIYTSPGYWSGIGNPSLSPLPYLWVANWGVSCPNLPPEWGRLRIWQYTDSGHVPGISGAVDLDEYNGSLAELKGL